MTLPEVAIRLRVSVAEYKLVVQADDFIATLRNRADAHTSSGHYPLWQGWALREAWLGGHRVGSLSFSTGVVHAVPERVWVDGVLFVRADLPPVTPPSEALGIAQSNLAGHYSGRRR